MAIFGPKPWLNHFEKMSVFRVFEHFSFCSLKRRFFVLEYRNRHFPGKYFLRNKSWKNGHFLTRLEKCQFFDLDQNHGLAPLEKCQFFEFLTSCVYSLKRLFFVLELVKDILLAYIFLKKTVGKMAIFWTKTMG